MNILTYFKNYTPTFFTFIKFYNEVWKINNFNYFIGYSTNEDYNFILNNYVKSCGTITNDNKISVPGLPDYCNNLEILETKDNNTTYRFILYKTDDINSLPRWDDIKQNLHWLFYKLNPSIFSNILTIDDDEFLYSTNMPLLLENIKEKKFYRFHYIEFYPQEPNNLHWCLQSWYNHVYKSLNSNSNKCKYSCNSCKTFIFDINESKNHEKFSIFHGMFIHSQNNYYNNSCCELFQNNKIYENLTDYYKLVEKGICFHFTGLDLDNIIYTRNFNRVQLRENYEKFKSVYQIIKDNTLLSYIDNRDIELKRK
jgi:hypothetical protein